MKEYSTEDYESLYVADTDGIESINNENVKGYAGKETYAGKMLYVDYYPLWNTDAESKKAAAAIKGDLDENGLVTQKRWSAHNEKVSRRNFIRKVHANFVEGDASITLTFDPKKATPRSRTRNTRSENTYAAFGHIASATACPKCVIYTVLNTMLTHTRRITPPNRNIYIFTFL